MRLGELLRTWLGLAVHGLEQKLICVSQRGARYAARCHAAHWTYLHNHSHQACRIPLQPIQKGRHAGDVLLAANRWIRDRRWRRAHRHGVSPLAKQLGPLLLPRVWDAEVWQWWTIGTA